MERRFESVLLTMPRKMGKDVVNFALDNFKRQAWLGSSVQPWRPRKNPNKWGQKPKRNGRAILMDTGRLRRSIDIIRTTVDSVTVGTDVPYAKAHNEGLRVGEIQQVSEHTRKLTTVAKVSSIKSKRTTTKRVQTGTTTVKAHTRRINQNIPRRQFLPTSATDAPYLVAKLKRTLNTEILNALK